jgi:tetratricopeptide (TPR) repeat protein
MREVEAAEHAYLQGFALLATLGDTTMMHEYKARICEGLGTVLSRSQPRKALEWIEQGLRDLHGTGTTAEGRLWLGKGSALLFIGEKEAAAQALQCALACLPADASELRTRTLINLGNICCEQGESEAGQHYYTQALQLCDATGNILDKAVIATNLAVEICVSGDWTGAIAELQRALALAEVVGNRETQAILASNLGYIYTTLGDLEAARASFMHSIELLERYQFSRYLIDTYTSLAHLHIRAEEWEAAAAALSRAEQCIQDTDATCALAEIQRGRAHIALAGGHPEEAHTAALQALQHAEQADPREEGMSLEVLATCLAALGQQQQAIEMLHRSLEVLTPYPYETALAQMALARILLQASREHKQHAALQPHTLLEQARATFERLGAQHDLAALEPLQRLSLQQQEDETMPP